MPKSNDDEFWKRQFDLGGNLPGPWFDSAFGLLTAGDVLGQFTGDLTRETTEAMKEGDWQALKMTRRRYERTSVRRVVAMLRAMAVECLLKALWVKNGGKLAEDGRYKGVMRGKEHQLH